MSENPIRLPVFDTVSLAWSKVSGAKGAMWAVLICIFLLEIVAGVIDAGIHTGTGESRQLIDNNGIVIVAGIIDLILIIFVYLLEFGLAYLGIQKAQDIPIQFSQVKHVFDWGMFFRLIGVFLMKIVVLLPAIILLMLPSILKPFAEGTDEVSDTMSNVAKLATAACYIVGWVLAMFLICRIWLGTAFVLAQRANPVAAIKASFQATKSNVWNIIGITIINMCILIVSMIPLGIGLIWSLPYMMVCYGVIYKKLAVDAGIVITKT